MTDNENTTSHKQSARKFAPFEDGNAVTYTIREVHREGGEYQSQHRDLAAAADAFAQACLHAACVELRDRTGRIIAGYAGGGIRTAA